MELAEQDTNVLSPIRSRDVMLLEPQGEGSGPSGSPSPEPAGEAFAFLPFLQRQ